MIGQLPRSLAPLPDESLHEFRSLRAPVHAQEHCGQLGKVERGRAQKRAGYGFSATEFHLFEYAAS
jgi:hypothetical protein